MLLHCLGDGRVSAPATVKLAHPKASLTTSAILTHTARAHTPSYPYAHISHTRAHTASHMPSSTPVQTHVSARARCPLPCSHAYAHPRTLWTRGLTHTLSRSPCLTHPRTRAHARTHTHTRAAGGPVLAAAAPALSHSATHGLFPSRRPTPGFPLPEVSLSFSVSLFILTEKEFFRSLSLLWF